MMQKVARAPNLLGGPIDAGKRQLGISVDAASESDHLDASRSILSNEV